MDSLIFKSIVAFLILLFIAVCILAKMAGEKINIPKTIFRFIISFIFWYYLASIIFDKLGK